MPTPTAGAARAEPQTETFVRLGKRPRDLRLDFFRGLAMFIILIAHTPGNAWALWIPARFGFSDAADIFVFCSGMASAIAFGSVFVQKSWFLGAARVAFRMFQVYWAHIGVILVTATILYAIDLYGWGSPDKVYITEPYVVPLFEQTGQALIGLLTLTYVPGLFDILPMYLVILGMIPVVMAIHRFGGREAVFAAMLVVWLLAQLAGFAWLVGPTLLPGDPRAWLASLGESLQFLNFSSVPWEDQIWFFNPFGWQLIFFTGFSFGMRWLPAPPVTRRLVLLAAAYLLLSVPFAWFKIHEGFYLPDEWALQDWIEETRIYLEPLHWKPWIGALRYGHFLALAYLAWASVGPGGIRLREGFKAPRPSRRTVLIGAGAVLIATAPYALVDEIKQLSPAIDAWLLRALPAVNGDRIGMLQIANMIALLLLLWAAIGAKARAWTTGAGFLAAVPVIRKVGTQSLAVFMVSIPLSVVDGLILDLIGRDVWTRLVVNALGCGVLIAVAYVVGWFKGNPWRREVRPAEAPKPVSVSTPRGLPAE